MIDRERLLASDHETRLRAEAHARRTARLAGKARTTGREASPASFRALVGRLLVTGGRRLAAEPDACAQPEPHAA